MSDQIFIDTNSVLHSRDYRQLPEWVCYDHVITKTMKDGRVLVLMKNVTPVDPLWLGSIAMESNLLKIGKTLDMPRPNYDAEQDVINCFVTTKYGDRNWMINPVKVRMSDALWKNPETCANQTDDCYRWFARSLLEGKVIDKLRPLYKVLDDDVAIITKRKADHKVISLVSALSSAKIDSLSSLRKHWKNIDSKFLLNEVMSWINHDSRKEAKQLWISTVQEQTLL